MGKGPKMESEMSSIPKLDFSGIEPGTTVGSDALQCQVIGALESHGCFEVVYDRVTPELRDGLFGRAMPQLFDLPLHVKILNKSDLLSGGYIGQIPGMAYEGLQIPEDVEKFTRIMWPRGNTNFSETVSTYLKNLKDLEQTIVRIVFSGLGIEEYCDSYIESSIYGIRLAEYGIPLDQESKIALPEHWDPNLITIICQHQVEGLEIQRKLGEWIPVLPSPNSFTVIIGEAFQAWTNGRLQAPLHRVRVISNEKRYSASFSSGPRYDCIIQTPKELVDEEHPLLYKPYTYPDHISFRYSKEEDRSKSTLKDFCGIRGGTATLNTIRLPDVKAASD